MFARQSTLPAELRKQEARRLRREGLPVSAIATAVGASQSSVSRWTRDIALSPEQVAANARAAAAARAVAKSTFHRRMRVRFQEEGRERARRGEPLHVAGCMLYWAEGSKDPNTAQIANSDPAMLEFFTSFLRGCFGITSDDMTFKLNVYTGNGLTLDEVELTWMDRLGLARRSARKHIVNHFPTSSSGARKAKLPSACALSR